MRRWFPFVFALLLFAACGVAAWTGSLWAIGAIVALAMVVVLLWEKRCSDQERALLLAEAIRLTRENLQRVARQR